jgi:hypothetical protein
MLQISQLLQIEFGQVEVEAGSDRRSNEINDVFDIHSIPRA